MINFLYLVIIYAGFVKYDKCEEEILNDMN